MITEAPTKRVKWTEMTPLPDNPIQMARIERIEADGGYSIAKAGTPVLCLNDAPAFPDLPTSAVILADGNHRKVLAERAGKGDEPVITRVHKGLTRPEIARLFLDLNDYREHRANELFVRRVEAQEAKAVKINEIITAAGWHVPTHSNTKTHGGILATAALEWVYDGAPPKGQKPQTKHPRELTRTVECLAAMYGTNPGVPKGNMIKGLGLFFLHYGEKVNIPRLVERLPSSLPTVQKVLNAAEYTREHMNYNVAESVARVIRQHYNGPRRSKQDLVEW